MERVLLARCERDALSAHLADPAPRGEQQAGGELRDDNKKGDVPLEVVSNAPCGRRMFAAGPLCSTS